MVYLDVDCPRCGAHRVEEDGVCEKCGWDVDAETYASISRPLEYDSLGRVPRLPFVLPELLLDEDSGYDLPG